MHALTAARHDKVRVWRMPVGYICQMMRFVLFCPVCRDQVPGSLRERLAINVRGTCVIVLQSTETVVVVCERDQRDHNKYVTIKT